MVNDDIKKNVLQQLKHFLCQFRSFHGTYIPPQRTADLVELLHRSANISITLDKENPLSVMETLTMVLCVLNTSDDDIADVLSVSLSTVQSYVERVKDKLNVTTKIKAVKTVLRKGIIKIIY